MGTPTGGSKTNKTANVQKADRKVSPGFIDGMKRFGVDSKVVDAAKRRNERISSQRAAG